MRPRNPEKTVRDKLTSLSDAQLRVELASVRMVFGKLYAFIYSRSNVIQDQNVMCICT